MKSEKKDAQETEKLYPNIVGVDVTTAWIRWIVWRKPYATCRIWDNIAVSVFQCTAGY